MVIENFTWEENILFPFRFPLPSPASTSEKQLRWKISLLSTSERRAVWGRISQSIIQMGWDLLGNLLLTFAEYVKVLRAFAPKQRRDFIQWKFGINKQRKHACSGIYKLVLTFMVLFFVSGGRQCEIDIAEATERCDSNDSHIIIFSHEPRAGSLAAAQKLHARTGLPN